MESSREEAAGPAGATNDSGAALPPPPWVRGANKPVRRQLSLEAVLAAALRVLDVEGLEAVTMRRVAQELRTGPGSLYAYVQNKRELHELLLDEALAAVRVPEPDPARWRDQLLDLLTDTVAAMVAKPGVARVSLETAIPTTPSALRLMDGVLGLLAAGGIPVRDAIVAADILALQLTAAAYEMSVRPGPGEAAAELERCSARVGDYLDILPPGRLPHLRAVRAHFATDEGAADDTVRTGLALLLDGIAAGASRS